MAAGQRRPAPDASSGARVTPNQHKLVRGVRPARQHLLLRHPERRRPPVVDDRLRHGLYREVLRGWPRSYPDGMGEDEVDALAYAPTGFLWDNALKHGKTLRDYGEFAMHKVRWADPQRKGEPDWTANWREYNNPKGEIIFESEPAVEVAAALPRQGLRSAGTWRSRTSSGPATSSEGARRVREERRDAPARSSSACPTTIPAGRARARPPRRPAPPTTTWPSAGSSRRIAKSRFWKDTVVFGIEDDPQDGWDHVSGYRTTAYVASPYTKRGQVVCTFYNTVSLLRTIEQILGLPPMNQFDAAADPDERLLHRSRPTSALSPPSRTKSAWTR